MFKPQLGKNIEIYIDDMVVKSMVVPEHVRDLGNIFEILRKHKLRLNASKCSFGVGSGKFLGYMVTHQGIEVNLDQIKVDGVLFTYIVMAPHAISLVLIRVDSGVQRPVYYVSKSLLEAEVLTDLVVEFAEPSLEEVIEAQHMDGKSVGAISLQEPLFWKVYVDGVANQMGFGVGLILISPEKLTIKKSLRLGFSATNNEVEYKALLEGMSMVQRMGGKLVKMFLDSRLVVG
ncbi:uncharacterized protein LOC115972184 [Quercus lobata]|uniref:uncharacterized protein LOC115972184 n=1 Tax=Quercus lobata TaxID=97700 RepID=UPI001243A9A8|nr:uncharacterized protein LOC115972184 [Quercus lobata]